MNNKYTWQSMAHAVPPITITTSDEQSEVSDNTDDPDFVPSLHPSRPLVRHATAPNAAKAPKRSKRPEPSPTLKALFARAYTSVDAIKDQLREWNPNCIPRVRSCSGLKGRNVRFGCRHEKVVPHMCRLNVSALQENGIYKMSCQTYRSGCCGLFMCHNCDLQLEDGMYMQCDNLAPHKHAICKGCFNEMVRCRFVVLYAWLRLTHYADPISSIRPR